MKAITAHLNPMTAYSRIKTPLGPMIIALRDTSLAGAWFEGQKHFPTRDATWVEVAHAEVLDEATRELDEYFAGRRTTFAVPLAGRGTPFQQEVWRAIAAVPYGDTITYGELARRVGHPRGVRAAGAATGRNPLSIFVPCHRIVGADGRLTGYAGGLDRKRALLARERDAQALQLDLRAA